MNAGLHGEGLDGRRSVTGCVVEKDDHLLVLLLGALVRLERIDLHLVFQAFLRELLAEVPHPLLVVAALYELERLDSSQADRPEQGQIRLLLEYRNLCLPRLHPRILL